VVYSFGRMEWTQWAAPVALAVTLLAARWARIHWNPLDIGIMAYFLILSVLSLTGAEEHLPARTKFALCPAVLAVAAAASVMWQRPFTLAYAWPYAPPLIRVRPAFFRANQIMSLLWVAGFAIAATLINFWQTDWSPARAAIILVSTLGMTAVGTGAIALWFHLRETRATA